MELVRLEVEAGAELAAVEALLLALELVGLEPRVVVEEPLEAVVPALVQFFS